ncbi:hypothetical protein LQ948_11135 [Jiella sp. MQZ9-1]|uniref:EthD domain-containing protein n=1 Tax=Jiella flava TaxID=2816857 RepID=A0A939FWD2_9HYPH|nr:DUF4286 family protein [Jiella flava]MBO0663188.1 hypothetical protein [Jiella flava]MCD2471762.1 hypothetical protein [Jiella flava]
MLLLDVQVDIDPAKEDILNEWYYAHVPRLVSLPGYESGRRYASLTPGPRYLALYEIRDESYLPSLLGDDPSLRQPLTLSEWSRWEKDLVPHMSHCRTNLYQAPNDLSLPLLRSAPAIVTVRMDCRDGPAALAAIGAALNAFVSTELDVLGVRLLQAASDPAMAWLGTTPNALLIVECAGSRSAREIALRTGPAADLLDALAAQATARPQAVAYERIADHRLPAGR